VESPPKKRKGKKKKVKRKKKIAGSFFDIATIALAKRKKRQCIPLRGDFKGVSERSNQKNAPPSSSPR
jgi:hypothetical protein